MEWQPISAMRTLRYGTVADVRMESGRIYRAVYGFKGRCCAWWPISNVRKKPIGTASPVAFRVHAIGTVAAGNWAEAVAANHAALV